MPPRRVAVTLPELDHPQPIPVAVWMRDTLYSSPVGPRRDDGSVPGALVEQLTVTFANLDRILAAAGVTRDAVAVVRVQLVDAADRPALNERWVAFFPDEPRPARQVTQAVLPAGVRVLLTFVAHA